MPIPGASQARSGSIVGEMPFHNLHLFGKLTSSLPSALVSLPDGIAILGVFGMAIGKKRGPALEKTGPSLVS